MADLLFVYGTSCPGHAPVEVADVVKSPKAMGKGTIRGQLYHLGDYTGVVITKRKEIVRGVLFALPDDTQTLQRLDEYEDFRPLDPANNLFLRARRIVTLADKKRRRCWVYLYNGELPSAH